MEISLWNRKVAASEQAASCHSNRQQDTKSLPLVAIVGTPNVGKSVLFNKLTGAYVTVSNYPGTTVEVSRGKGKANGTEVGVVDTPGMYRLLPITEEERVARRILLHERPAVVIHVVDAKNLPRMLPMTLQLREAGLPVILDVNLMDEAEWLGVQVDTAALERKLGIPVVPTALAVGRGTVALRDRIAGELRAARGVTDVALPSSCHSEIPASNASEKSARAATNISYTAPIEQAITALQAQLETHYQLSTRAIALLLLQNDTEVMDLARKQEEARAQGIERIVAETRSRFGQPLAYVIARQQQAVAQNLLDSTVTFPERRRSGFAQRLSAAMIHPLTGIPILIAALWLLYEFVGVLGAQTLVAWLEGTVFGGWINPVVNQALNAVIPWPALRSLFGGDYGMITLGVRYAMAIILPIVGTFFIAFSIIEDSGYLPRLAMLVDRVMKPLGLNGRAVIPLVLGLGCDTMATIVTRTLETKRERILSTILLSLAIPCSAQLGVMLALLGGRPGLLAIWAAIVVGILLLVGFLAAQLMPGERPTFYMELPPLRMPTLGNIFVKTYTRIEWYLREVFPMFILASVVIWLGHLTGLFDVAVNALVPLVRWLGLPDGTAVAFLFGFFRRDYGAAGLYDMQASLSAAQLLVATVTMTIFVPCIAQFSVTAKERGWKTAMAIAAFIFPFAFAVGGALNWILTALRM
ncbi:MAG: ferrous iron transport protein B [Anaerolineae bacterium]